MAGSSRSSQITRPCLEAVSPEPLFCRVAGALHQAIAAGNLGPELPPERVLCRDLRVSRPTLRAAIQILRDKGILKLTGQGRQRQWRVSKCARRRAIITRGRRVVRFLQNPETPQFLSELLLVHEHLAAKLPSMGLEFHAELNREVFRKKPASALERLITTRPADLWVLCLSSRAMQEWFQEREIPCIVLGSCFAGVSLPSIDEDYFASCRHAAGLFLSRGHRNLAVLMPPDPHPGDLAARDGLVEGCAGRPDVTLCEIFCGSEVPEVRRAVDELLRRPERPSGWLILDALTCLAVASCLGEKALRPGSDISFISRRSDPYFATQTPSIAHYQRPTALLNERLVRFIVSTLRRNEPKTLRVLSEYRPGGSLGRQPRER